MIESIIAELDGQSAGSISSIPLLDYASRRRLRSMRDRKGNELNFTPSKYDNCLRNSLKRLQCEARTRRASKIGVFYWSLNTVGVSSTITRQYIKDGSEDYNVFGFMKERSMYEDPVMRPEEVENLGQVEINGLSAFVATTTKERMMRQFVSLLRISEQTAVKKKNEASDSLSKHVTVPQEILDLVENAWKSGEWGSSGWDLNAFINSVETKNLSTSARKTLNGPLLISAARKTIQPGGISAIPPQSRRSLQGMILQQDFEPFFNEPLHPIEVLNEMEQMNDSPKMTENQMVTAETANTDNVVPMEESNGAKKKRKSSTTKKIVSKKSVAKKNVVNAKTKRRR